MVSVELFAFNLVVSIMATLILIGFGIIYPRYYMYLEKKENKAKDFVDIKPKKFSKKEKKKLGKV